MTKCFPLIRGRTLRATKLDGCGNTVPGSQSQVVTDGYISVALTANTEEGEEIQITNAAGKICISDIPAPTLIGYGIEVTLCGVDPSLINLLTGQAVVYNDDTTPEVVGFRVNSGVDLDQSGFALEVWTGVPSTACEPGEDQSYGYLLIPFVKGGVLGDFTIENGAVNFQITGANSKDGSLWGVGPYDVVLDGTDTPSPLLTAIDTKDHLHLELTQVAPPASVCGAQALGTEATTATEVVGAAATLTPANSYPPYDLADANTAVLLTASPATAWSTGSYVAFEDGSHGYWNGTTWAAGEAP
jgi:hypothetical protein